MPKRHARLSLAAYQQAFNAASAAIGVVTAQQASAGDMLL